MPPKNVYTEESILDAVISLARREGPGAVAARAIGKELGCAPNRCAQEGLIKRRIPL